MKNRNQIVLFRKIAGTLCMLALFSCLMGIGVYAAENGTDVSQAVAVSSRTTEDAVYVYIKGVGDLTDGTTVQVGNTLCEDIQVANVVSMGIPIRTTILLDNSMSLSKRWGEQARELIGGLIDNHAEGEEFKIATFADGLNVVADFSTEYEALKEAAEGIEFLNQYSYLTDILYDLLKQSGNNGEANFTRFIIITDGADDQDIKYTQAELTDLMKSSGVVIHTVGVKTSDNNNFLENLFSYARLTGGTYKIAENDTAVEEVRGVIDEDYSLLCLRLVPEANVMDGSRRETKFHLSTSNGTVVLTASLQMPFADVNSIPSEAGESSDPSESVSAPTEEKTDLPSIAVEPKPGKEGEDGEPGKSGIGFLFLIVIVIVVLAVIITLTVLLLVLRGKRKKQVDVIIANDKKTENEDEKEKSQNSSVEQGALKQRGGNTERLGGQAKSDETRKTLRLQGGTGQNGVRQSYIVLTEIGNPQRIFRAPIDTRLVIGREEGDIILGHDAAVSYTHCEILKKGNLYYVNDLKSSNGTFYASERVYRETPILNGGTLELGTCKYKITIENQNEGY